MNHDKKTKNTNPVQNLFDLPVYIELTSTSDQTFNDILLNAIDKALSTLGESAKTAIYFYLDNIFKIKKQDIPLRIDDFQNALEKLFGIGSEHLEILFIKNLYEELKTTYKLAMPRWAAPDLTFREYLTLAKMNFESSNSTNKK